MKQLAILKAVGGLIVLAVAAPVVAQEIGVLEEIIVTAQKREQSLTELGIAVDVVPGERLREGGASMLIDVAKYSPGLNIRGPFGDYGYPIITLRGVNTDGFIETLPQSTGVYSDGIYISQPPMLALRLLDLERMEVLKGPQGTIYGRNTIAGAVNFISKRPTREAEGYVNVGFGNYSRATVDAAYGGPMSDTAAGRFAVSCLTPLMIWPISGNTTNRITRTILMTSSTSPNRKGQFMLLFLSTRVDSPPPLHLWAERKPAKISVHRRKMQNDHAFL